MMSRFPVPIRSCSLLGRWLAWAGAITTVAWGLHAMYRVLADEARSHAFEEICRFRDERIREASGIARSIVNRHCVWVHNDSGDEARLFLVDTRNGSTEAVLQLTGESALDFEDVCSFTCEGKNWLLVGDIGDNSSDRGPAGSGATRSPCRLLLVEEPMINRESGPEDIKAVAHHVTEFTFEDGARDCESLGVDSARREILLISKSKRRPLDCGVYGISLDLEKGSTVARAKRLGSLDLQQATAMDIAPDNSRMIVVSYTHGIALERTPMESWSDAIKRGGRSIQLPRRRQGETVCFAEDRNAVLLTSEHLHQPIWRLNISSNSVP